MAGIKDIAKGRSDVFRVRPADLHIKEGWNSREDDDPDNQKHIDQLARSIAAEGVKEPLTGYMEDGKLYIENGHCRHAAALKAISEYEADPEMLVPVRMSDKEATEADRVLSQIIRNSGKPLSPMELASVFKRLRSLDLSDGEIARRTGFTRVYVGQLMALSEQPKTVTNLVRDGSVSATLAIEVMKKNDGDGKKTAAALKDAVKTAKAAGKTRATKKHVKDDGEGVPKAEKPNAIEGGKKMSSTQLIAEVRSLVEASTVSFDDTEEHTTIYLGPADYDRLADLLDLTVRRPSEDSDLI